MAQDTLAQMHSDCSILLNRAFIGKTIYDLGIDGQSDQGTNFAIRDVQFILSIHSTGILTSTAYLNFTGCMSSGYKHLTSSLNATRSINACLADQHIDSDCWAWADLAEQGSEYITLTIYPFKLLQ